MTLVIYREHRIEIEYDGKLGHYAIFGEDGFLVAEDSVEMPKKELIADCQWTVDDYIKNPRDYR